MNEVEYVADIISPEENINNLMRQLVIEAKKMGKDYKSQLIENILDIWEEIDEEYEEEKNNNPNLTIAEIEFESRLIKFLEYYKLPVRLQTKPQLLQCESFFSFLRSCKFSPLLYAAKLQFFDCNTRLNAFHNGRSTRYNFSHIIQRAFNGESGCNKIKIGSGNTRQCLHFTLNFCGTICAAETFQTK